MKRLLQGAGPGIPQQDRDDIDGALRGQASIKVVNHSGQRVLAKLALGPSRGSIALDAGQTGAIMQVKPGKYAFHVRLGDQGNYSYAWGAEFQLSGVGGTYILGPAQGGQALRDSSKEDFDATP